MSENLTKQCPKCGNWSTSSGRYCLQCGADLANPTSASARTAALSAAQSTPTAFAGAQKVVVTDINMTFGSMVVFMIKWALAAIPAIIILSLILGIVSAILGGLAGSILYGLF